MTTTSARPTVETPEAGDPRLDADVTNVDIAHLQQVLLGHYPELRLAARKLMADERFHRIEGQSLADHRERVLGQPACSPPRATCTARSRSGSAAPRTTAASWPGSRSSRTRTRRCRSSPGVQWGLFASAIYHLGTERNHDEFLADALSVKVPGRVRDDGDGPRLRRRRHRHHRHVRPRRRRSSSSTRRSARRGRTTSATPGCTAQAATVFAQLITGGVNHGVHAFYVPLRDDDERVPARRRRRGRRPQGRPQRHRQRPALVRPRAGPAHQPAQPLRRRRRGRHLLVAHPEPRPPLLHDARHARAGPRLARRRRGHRRARSA